MANLRRNKTNDQREFLLLYAIIKTQYKHTTNIILQRTIFWKQYV